ncbi:50S ribosomal protein L20 [candidate division KSB3 bacterium]|uniref:Large ribosomal subunit protein bL20 n=1 Tax=candidate division KSB3 bacterium TaxID=2044937 RepID=A0A2G6EAD1_9BACT|nr:MAG: 50S ribosomal protein L20 [candidate division KSB3 bacterium]PIE30793.1 MAG: 50S ribosomal protein L20 [candidate division KSB3 bacterium]
MRVKGGNVSRKRRKKILKLAKGFRGGRSKLFRTAKNAVIKALTYSYRDRRRRKRDFRRLWIVRINAAARACGMPYSKFMKGLQLANVRLDRRVLANLAMEDSAVFAHLVDTAKSALESAAA